MTRRCGTEWRKIKKNKNPGNFVKLHCAGKKDTEAAEEKRGATERAGKGSGGVLGRRKKIKAHFCHTDSRDVDGRW